MTSIFNYRLSFTLLATVWSFIFLFQIVVFHAIFSPINYNLNCPCMHSFRTTFQGNGLFNPPPFFLLLLLIYLFIIFLQAQIQLSIDRTLEKALLQGWNISSDWNLFDVVLCTLSTNIFVLVWIPCLSHCYHFDISATVYNEIFNTQANSIANK